MNIGPSLKVLLVEDNVADALLLCEAFAEAAEIHFTIEHAERLGEGLKLLNSQKFDAALLDLGLPDSQGIETFVRLHQHMPELPVVVLTGLNDEAIGTRAVQMGAQDYLQKKQMHSPLLERSIRYAVERNRLQQELEDTRQRDAQEQEFKSMARLSGASTTQVTAQIYSAGPLRELLPHIFEQLIEQYQAILDQSFQQRVFKVENHSSEALRLLSDELASLRASPRDVIEIHSAALKKQITDIPLKKAQAYLEEGRITVLELMGYLAGHYRNYYPGSQIKESNP